MYIHACDQQKRELQVLPKRPINLSNMYTYTPTNSVKYVHMHICMYIRAHNHRKTDPQTLKRDLQILPKRPINLSNVYTCTYACTYVHTITAKQTHKLCERFCQKRPIINPKDTYLTSPTNPSKRDPSIRKKRPTNIHLAAPAGCDAPGAWEMVSFPLATYTYIQ